MQDERGRRGREDYQELDRLRAEADRSLEGEDLSGANEALEQAGIKAASMWGEDGRTSLPAHTRKLVGLRSEVREDLKRRNFPHALRKDLRQLRSRCALEARREAKKTAAGARPARREEGAGRTVSAGGVVTVRESLHDGTLRALWFSLRCYLAKRGR